MIKWKDRGNGVVSSTAETTIGKMFFRLYIFHPDLDYLPDLDVYPGGDDVFQYKAKNVHFSRYSSLEEAKKAIEAACIRYNTLIGELALK